MNFDFGNAGLFALAGASLTAVVGLWGQFRGILKQVSGLLLVQTIVLNHGELYLNLARYIKAECKFYSGGVNHYKGYLIKLKNKKFASGIPFWVPNTTGILVSKFGIFLLNAGNQLTLISIRGLGNPEELIREAVRWDETKKMTEDSNRYYHVRLLGHAGEPFSAETGISKKNGGRTLDEAVPSYDSNSNEDNHWNRVDPLLDRSLMYSREDYVLTAKDESLKGLVLSDEAHQLLQAADDWYNKSDWYLDRGIPWRIGFLLWGPVGTGKSTLARTVAQRFGIPIFQLHLSTFSDSELVREWERLDPPCVILLEDFDNVFHLREPVTSHKSLSFDTVLNLISGVGSQDGVMLIVTTNKIELIDPALGNLDENGNPTRPGRVDHILHFGACSQAMLYEMANRILQDWPDLIETTVTQGRGMTLAQFQNLCRNVAFKRMRECK